MSLDDVFGAVQLTDTAQTAIRKTLSSLDDEVVKEWLDKLSINRGRIGGTYYSNIASRLSEDEFRLLYEALGYDFSAEAIWKNWWCAGAEGCTKKDGYTCDTAKCP